MDFENDVIIQGICKSIIGEEDENGNYKFEVEASNENLDLQNQITLQSALQKSKEYFVTNGVISDDHLHKTRNPDGTVETHKDKIIGEPVSVRFDPATKKTFVKGVLYSGIEAAKPYIELLKNKSKVVKASIGGIMPKIKHNADGTETVTSFMWNDLALTTSPVNWTVGSAKFAKSIGVTEFCKSLNAGSGTDAATMEGGRSLQTEDLEDDTKKLMNIADGDDIKDEDESEDFEKSVIKEAISLIDNKVLNTYDGLERFFLAKGFNTDMASETSLEIIKQGGSKMPRSNFSSTITDLLKSFKEEAEDKKKKNPEEDEDMIDDQLDFESGDDDDGDYEVEKSMDDGDYLDATELMKSMGEELDSLRTENEELKKSVEELQNNMIEVTKSFGDFIKTPNARQTVVQKSMPDNIAVGNVKPTKADLDILNKALVSAAKNGEISIDAVQYYSSEFQKSMKGEKVDPNVMSKIFAIVKNNK